MKKIVVAIVVLLVFLNWDTFIRSGNFRSEYEADPNAKVTLYATSWCGYCKRARKLFKDNSIDYYEYDIEKSKDGYQQYKKLGGKAVPLIVINGAVIHGFNRERILNLAEKI